MHIHACYRDRGWAGGGRERERSRSKKLGVFGLVAGEGRRWKMMMTAAAAAVALWFFREKGVTAYRAANKN